MKLFNPTQCLCFPSDTHSNGRRLQTVLLDVEYRGMGHSLTHILCWLKFLGKKEERLSRENILSGSLMRGITSKSLHKHSHHPLSNSACQSGYRGSWRKYRSCHWNSKLGRFWMIDVHQMTCWFANTVKLKNTVSWKIFWCEQKATGGLWSMWNTTINTAAQWLWL